MVELKDVAVNIPVAPHRSQGHVRVTPERSSGARLARVDVVLAVTGKVQWTGYVHGQGKEQLKQEDVVQLNRPKKIVTLLLGKFCQLSHLFQENCLIISMFLNMVVSLFLL